MELDNVKGIEIPIYSDEDIKRMLSKEDLEEFLIMLGYTKEDL